MSLTDSIHMLTRPHLATAPDGTLRHAPALLGELRAAVTPGRNSSGGGGAEGAPSPIDLGAVDMLATMTKDAREDYCQISGDAWSGELEALLHRLAEMNLPPEWHNYLERVTVDWVDQITAYLWPVKPRRKLVGKVCPSCGFATYGDERKTTLSLGCWDSEGGMKKTSDWDVECAGCEAYWSGDKIGWLITALDASDTPTKQSVADVEEVA